MGIEDGNLNPLLRQQFNREDHGRILLKQEFLAPFVESEVIQGFNQPLSVSEKKSYFVEGKQPMFEVYRKVYGEYLYRIFKTPGKETHNNDFLFTLSKDEQAPPVNELGFHYMSSPKGSGYDIGHRIVRSQKEGISGSDYLRKAEEYLSILRKNNHISYNVLGAHSPQIGVTEFFLKNGYDFFSPEHKELFQDLKAHPEKYQMVVIGKERKNFHDAHLEGSQTHYPASPSSCASSASCHRVPPALRRSPLGYVPSFSPSSYSSSAFAYRSCRNCRSDRDRSTDVR
jgi:hypothetical protein